MASLNVIFILPAAFFLLYFLVSSASLTTSNITRDQSALLELKASVVDPHHFLDNWSTNVSVCEWIGVTCSRRHPRVTALNVSSMNLTGTIPPGFGNLSFLASLDVSYNNFHGDLLEELVRLRRLKSINFTSNTLGGQLPSWLGSFPKLQHLLLADNSFTGFIPRSIANSTNLQSLELWSNSLGGQIPQEIGSLGKLAVLNIEKNKLTGSIPDTIFNISSLEILSLAYNNLTGNLPVHLCGHLSMLKELHLSYNQLHGLIPLSPYECSHLEILALPFNNLSGSVPMDIGNLTMLRGLYLGVNKLTGSIPPGIFNLSQLQDLALEFNHFSGNLPSSMGYTLPNLELLSLTLNNFSGLIPDSISNCSRLNTISLSVNKFTGLIPTSLGQLRLLERFRVDNNSLSGLAYKELSFITSLTNCRQLNILDVANNPLNGFLPSSIGNFSTALQGFYAYNCNIHGDIPDEIGNLSSVVALSLYINNLGGSIPTSVKGIQHLQALDLAINKIQGSIPDDLCNLPNLFKLRLGKNQITGKIPTCLGNISSLRLLYLNENMLDSIIPTSLWNLTGLLELSLYANSLNGYLPPAIANLKAATLVVLSENLLSGNVPTNIGGLENLIKLFLDHNKFQGTIPVSLGNILSLEVLDLSHNNLSDSIPKSLEALHYLRYFDVSFNKLRGEIPSGGPFAKFNSSSFISNEALCGNSRFLVSSCKTSSSRRSTRKKVLHMTFMLLGVALLIVGVAMAILLVRYRRRRTAQTTTEILPLRVLERISYYELLEATEGYNDNNLLGSGSFGSVYKGVLKDGTPLAVKVFNLQVEGAYKSFDVECEMLRNLRHRNLTKVITSCSNNEFKAIVLEYMPNGSLEKWLHSKNYFLDVMERLNVMIDVACALDYLHYGCSPPIVHCDLKPSNVLLDENMIARVSDFGIAKLLNEGDSFARTSTLATMGYIAPEYGSEGLVAPPCDIYSYGIMLMETFTRKKPSDEILSGSLSLKQWIRNSFPDELIQVIDADLLRPGEAYFTQKLKSISSIMELALSCSAESPKERMTMQDVLATLKKIKVQILSYT